MSSVRNPSPLTTLQRCGACLSHLPPYGSAGNDTRCIARITPAKKPVLRRSPYAGMLFNGQGRPLNLAAPAPTLAATMGGNRTPIVDQETLESGEDSWVVGYHRHLWSGRAPYKRIPKRLRRLTVEEAAAIQTFPRDMAWAGRVGSQFKQIGNAVPPRLAFHVALAVREALSLGEPAYPEWVDDTTAELRAATRSLKDRLPARSRSGVCGSLPGATVRCSVVADAGEPWARHEAGARRAIAASPAGDAVPKGQRLDHGGRSSSACRHRVWPQADRCVHRWVLLARVSAARSEAAREPSLLGRKACSERRTRRPKRSTTPARRGGRCCATGSMRIRRRSRHPSRQRLMPSIMSRHERPLEATGSADCSIRTIR